MASTNFFISESELPQQASASNYGSVSSTQYRVTSLFNGSISGNNPMAYAVASGKIFIVQQITNANRVNLFIRPEENLPGFPVVKYFVYRGLLKDDFLDAASGYTIIKPVATDDSVLIQNIRKGLDGIEALDLYTSLTDGFFIDDLFIKEDNQFALVRKGDSIGRFETISSGLDYGFEIILEEPCYNPDLGVARKDINIITIPSGTGEEAARLKTLAYLDPAAYYGFFSHKDFSVGTNNPSSPLSRSKEDIYELVKKFATKNTVYFDLRDKYGQPLDWFTANPQNIKITLDGTSALASSDVPYRTTNNYPLHIVDSGFSNVLTTEGQKYFTVNLSLSTSNNSSPLFILHSGYWNDNLPDFMPQNLFSKRTDSGGWTDDEKFTIYAATDSSSDIPVSTYLRLQYIEYTDALAFETNLPGGDFYEPQLIEFNGLFSPNSLRAPEYNDVTITNPPILNA